MFSQAHLVCSKRSFESECEVICVSGTGRWESLREGKRMMLMLFHDVIIVGFFFTKFLSTRDPQKSANRHPQKNSVIYREGKRIDFLNLFLGKVHYFFSVGEICGSRLRSLI